MFKRWLSLIPDKSALIIGPRRSGKTTYLKAQYPDFNYITLDDLDDLSLAKRDPKGFVTTLGKQAIIDEIQRLPELTVAVKYALDNQGAIFLMTGSSSIGLLDTAADTLAGRIYLYAMPPACWGENAGEPTHRLFDDEINIKALLQAQRLLPDALNYGQFPEVLTQPNTESKHNLLLNYRNTYFTRDLMQLSNIENIDALLSIFHHLARSIGSTLEVSNFAREAGVSFPTAKKYLNILLQSHLAFKLYGYQFGPAKRYIKASKMYYSDCGIIHSLNVRLNEGQLVENFVIAELEKRRKIGLIKTDQFYYYKSTSGREIDLVFEVDDTLYAVEIKATTKPGAKDFRNLKEFGKKMNLDTKLFLFYLGTEYYQVDDIRVIPIASLYRSVV